MNGFELQASDVGSDHYANWATTIVVSLKLFRKVAMVHLKRRNDISHL